MAMSSNVKHGHDEGRILLRFDLFTCAEAGTAAASLPVRSLTRLVP
jgi:hypothetical protein